MPVPVVIPSPGRRLVSEQPGPDLGRDGVEALERREELCLPKEIALRHGSPGSLGLGGDGGASSS